MDNSPGWTDEQIDILTDKWSTNSAAVIGAMINKTRNAVIGKAKRLNLPPKKESGGYSTQNTAKSSRAPQTKPTPIPIPIPVPVNGGIHIFDLVEHHCRAVIGRGADGLALFCGSNKQEPHPYCAGHAAIYYNIASIISR